MLEIEKKGGDVTESKNIQLSNWKTLADFQKDGFL